MPGGHDDGGGHFGRARGRDGGGLCDDGEVEADSAVARSEGGVDVGYAASILSPGLVALPALLAQSARYRPNRWKCRVDKIRS